MNENYACSIDNNKLSNSIISLVLADNYINNNDLLEDVQEIEKIINDTNFEHGNCIDNYKEDINILNEKIVEIKKDLSNLIDSLNYSIDKVNESQTINSDSLKELIGFYSNTTAANKINKLLSESTNNIGNVAMRKIMEATNSINQYNNYQDPSTVTTIPPVQTPTTQSVEQPYSTVPIGLGIAATGISAAAGTVYVDSKYDGNNHKKKFLVKEYDESEDEDIDDDEEIVKAEPYPKKEEEYIPPYHASRVHENDKLLYEYEDE